MSAESKLALVALGSNLGNPEAQVRKAITELRRFSHEPLVQSSLYRSTPVHCPPGSPPFVNAVVGFIPLPGQSPEALLAELLTLEKVFGRVRDSRMNILNAPRPLDLDLIAFAAEERATADLVLPHPRAHLRRFVLTPLVEIAPNLVLPGQTKSVRELLSSLRTDEIVEKM